MELIDRILAAALDRWPERWSHTALTVALAEGTPPLAPPGPDGLDPLAREVLEGLAAPRNAAAGARKLLSREAFDAVELMLERGALPLEEARQISVLLESARGEAARRAARALHLLGRRAHQLDADSWARRDGWTEEGLAELAADDPQGFAALLADWERRAAAEEQERRSALLDRVRAPAGALPLDEAGRARVRECVEAGEFRTAEWLLLRGQPPVPADAGPAGLPRPPRPTRLLRFEVDEVLGWYGEPGRASAELGGWLPAPADLAGRDLVAALSALTALTTEASAGARDPGCWVPAARELVAALHRCIGTAEAVVTARPLGGGVLSRLYCTGDHRLPPLGLFSREGIPLWVAPGDTEPPDELVSHPFVWLVPQWEGLSEAPDGCGPLFAEDLLQLAAPAPDGGVPQAAQRQLALLRTLGPGLGVRGLLDGGQRGVRQGLDVSGEGKATLLLSWFFDLLGHQAESVTVESVLYETGGHPLVLRELLDALFRERPPRYSPAALSERLEVVRDHPDWRGRAVRRVLDRLTDANSVAALFTALWLHAAGERGTFDLDELRMLAEELAGPGGPPPLLDLPGGTARLLSAGLVEVREGDRLALPPNGLPDLLAGGSGRAPGQWVADAFQELRAESEAAVAQVVMTLQEAALETVDHYNGNLIRQLDALADRMVEEQDVEQRMALREEHRRRSSLQRPTTWLMDRAMEPPGPLLLSEVVADRIRDEQLTSGGRDRIELVGADGLWVHANRWLLGQVFWNLFDNSRKAIDASGAEYGFLEVTVVPFTSPEGTPRCRIEVADSGEGLSEGVAMRLNRGERFSTRSGSGRGVDLARTLLRHYGGSLRVLPDPSDLGGACIRLELPLLPGGPGA